MTQLFHFQAILQQTHSMHPHRDTHTHKCFQQPQNGKPQVRRTHSPRSRVRRRDSGYTRHNADDLHETGPVGEARK